MQKRRHLPCDFLDRRASSGRAAVAALLLGTQTASAHFILQAPSSWMSQDSTGSPQKMGPCGDEGGGTPTNAITPYRPGDVVTITIQEVVFHPGHYRVALSVNSRSELPAEPAVTAASTPCGTAAVESPAVFPVLADGVLTHTSAFSGPQSIQVTLPSDVTCTKCTLQVIEFMSNHPLNNPGGCFYHHCADISILPAGAGGSSNAGGTSATATGGRTMATGGRTAAAGGASANFSGGTSSIAAGGSFAYQTGGTIAQTATTSIVVTFGGATVVAAGGSANQDTGGVTLGAGGSTAATGGTHALPSGGTVSTTAGGTTSVESSLVSAGGSGVLRDTPAPANAAAANDKSAGCACFVNGHRTTAHGRWGLSCLLLGLAKWRRRRRP